VFDDAAKVGLDESRVLTQFFELVAIVFDVDSVLVLDIDAGNMFGFFRLGCLLRVRSEVRFVVVGDFLCGCILVLGQ
jgi:hypothetical protein